ncbi:MAG: hypothetical protein RBR02_09455 [Desulfuromonadaceae bacterium]|nr:hypothetical protein [Desulfuromonadaceae bacterium]
MEAIEECQVFCFENELFLNNYKFDENSIEHVAVRFIQRVASEVQIPQGDKIQKNDCEILSIKV